MEFRVGDNLSILYKHDTLSEPHSVYNTVANSSGISKTELLISSPTIYNCPITAKIILSNKNTGIHLEVSRYFLCA